MRLKRPAGQVDCARENKHSFSCSCRCCCLRNDVDINYILEAPLRTSEWAACLAAWLAAFTWLPAPIHAHLVYLNVRACRVIKVSGASD